VSGPDRVPPRIRLLVTVTFNENQLRAHLLPILALPEVAEVLLVADRNLTTTLPGLRVIVPPRPLVRIFGRSFAKLLVCVYLARRERPDWVAGFNLVPHGINAVIAARVAGSRSLYAMIGGNREWIDGGFDSDNAVLGRLRRPAPRVERLLLAFIRRATRVVAMGSVGRSELIAHGVAPDRVAVIPPAVDTDRFKPASGADPGYDILTVGALLENKRTADLVRAAALLSARHPRLRVAVVGAGPLEQRLRRLSDELGVGDVVDFLGFRDDVAALYADARVFALPSSYEGLSIAMLEAMASGLPVVVTDVGELGGFVRDGETGRLFEPGDVEGLAGQLGELLDDDSRRAGLGAAAAADVRARASVAAVAELYRPILAPDYDPASSQLNE
jgi:glycosyltransferase involved in cell wall biosynthesis